MELAKNHSIVPFNETHIRNIRDDFGDKIRVEKIVTFADIKSVPAGYGSSRIGVIVLGGIKKEYLFNISNLGLYSDFGGGVKKKEKLYDGLIRELYQEVPQWADYFLSCAEAEYVQCHVVETLFIQKPELNRIEALVFIMVNEEEMVSFKPTKEVISVFIVPELYDLYIRDWLNGYDWTMLNTGLQQFRKYLNGTL